MPNHTSDKHEWFQKALKGDKKYKNYYVWADGKNKDDQTPPNNWISVFSDSAWTYVQSQEQWYLHQFDYRQPDLNFYNPDVQKEMKASVVQRQDFIKISEIKSDYLINIRVCFYNYR